MIFNILISITSNIIWVIMLGYSIFRFLRYSSSKYPKPNDISKKDYTSWRELENLALALPIIGLFLSSLLTFVFIANPRSDEQYLHYTKIRSLMFISGLVIVVIVHFISKSKAKKLGIIK